LLLCAKGFTQYIPPTNTSPVGHNNYPTGWNLIQGTPDVSDINGWSGFASLAWLTEAGNPVNNPPNGHTTWVTCSHWDITGAYITGLIPGKTYTLSFYTAELRTYGLTNVGEPMNNNYDGTLGIEFDDPRDLSFISYHKRKYTGGPSNAWSYQTVTFEAPYNTVIVHFYYDDGYNFDNGNTLNISMDGNAVAPLCSAGTTPPTLSGTTLSNTCPTTTVSLNTLTASNTPTGSSVTWHTGATATDANKIANPAAISTAGTYYAAFYNSAESCYSPTTPVTVTINTCPVDTDGDGIPDINDVDDDNDGILDTAEGCSAAVSIATVDSSIVTSLQNTSTAIMPLSVPGATMPFGGVKITRTAGANTWGTYQPPVSTATVTVNGITSSPFSTKYLDLVGTIPRTLTIDFGASASSLSTSTKDFYYMIGIAGLAGEGIAMNVTSSVTLKVAGNSNVFNTNKYSLLDGVVTSTMGITGTVITGNTPLTTGDGYTFYFIPKTASSFTLTYTGGNDPHGILFGVYSESCIDTDGDSIPDRLDLDSDNDGCVDAIEGGANISLSQLVNAGGTASVGTGSSAANQNLCASSSCVSSSGANIGLPQFATLPTGYSNTTGQTIGDSRNAAANTQCITSCYKPATTSGTTLDTKHGITALGRAGADNSNWPMVRKGAWTALEAKTKGFVINRLTDAQIAGIPAANLREGMMVYNITQDCLQINTDGTATGWKCYNTQTCPN
jgi:hypothetical protein